MGITVDNAKYARSMELTESFSFMFTELTNCNNVPPSECQTTAEWKTTSDW